MSRLLPSAPRTRPCPSVPSLVVLLASLLTTPGCGEVACPEGTSEDAGVCRPTGVTEMKPPANDPVDPGDMPREPEQPAPVERCDGVDNDGDDAVDEDWPELGQPCGEGGGVGECVFGVYVCSNDQLGVACDGAIEPTEEACDGKDNDCDGFIDEGALSTRREVVSERVSVVAIDGGFVVSRMVAGMLRIETYDTEGVRTGFHDDADNPSLDSSFMASAASGSRVLVAFGRREFHVAEAHVGADMVPIIMGLSTLHDEWDQGIHLGIYEPPHHPRVSAEPPRFVGYRDIVTFALTPFSRSNLYDLGKAPTIANSLSYLAYFTTAGSFVAWEQADNVRVGWLLDDGELLLDIDVGRGAKPAIALGAEGPGVAHLDEGRLLMTELVGLTLQCFEGGHCNDVVGDVLVDETSTTATGLAFDESRDAWVVAASERLVWVGRGNDGPMVLQELASVVSEDAPRRIEVAVSGGTAAVVQSTKRGDTALTFMGCF